jgi:hypothetical protein
MGKRKEKGNNGFDPSQKTQGTKVPKVQTRSRAKTAVSQENRVSSPRQDSSTGKETQTKSLEEIQEEKEQEALRLQIRNLKWIRERVVKKQLPIWTMDLETDPFVKDKVPVPFVVGLYDGVVSRKFWSDRAGSCVQKVKDFLEDVPKEERGIIYMHNGGRFDFFYLLDWFEGKTMIMSSRIVRAFFDVGNIGKKTRKYHASDYRFEFRDSYAIMPFPLEAYRKDEIDYQKLSRENRHKHKAEIESYLDGDCIYLWELCMEFQREFGDYLTIASAAFAQLNDMHKFEKLPQSQDGELRRLFYFGGRVECFEKGVISQPVGIYDVNSMYPSVMRDSWHPISHCTLEDQQIRWNEAWGAFKLRTYFLTVEGKNRGAFPTRMPDGSVDFTREEGIFHVSIHEWNTALALDCFTPRKVLRTYNFLESCHFDTFVNHFFHARNVAKENGDKIRTLFYKLILNSAYGKFALNPENYYSWFVTHSPEPPGGKRAAEWVLDSMIQGKYYIWKLPGKTYDWNLKNIATAASVTGAARSVLLRAIAGSKGVLYCDTDSLLCESFSGGELDEDKLGAWKCEGSGNLTAIAGKKMYAVFQGDECIKHATKGVVLTPQEILKVCQGEDVISYRDAPTFKRDGTAVFVERKVRMT